MAIELLVCPGCGGEKKQLAFFPVYSRNHTGPRPPFIKMTCPTCDGTGEITALQAEWMEQGKLLRKRRIDTGYGLREFAELCDMRASDVSYMEQGKTKPEWPANAPTE